MGNTVHNGAAGIDTEFRYHNALRNQKICRGDTQLPAQLLTGTDTAAENVGMAQIFCGAFHVTGFNQLADQGGGNALSVSDLLRNDHTGKTLAGAKRAQLIRVAFAPMAETEVVTADKACGTFCNQKVQKVLPRS